MHGYDVWGDFWLGVFFASTVFAIGYTVGYWVKDHRDHKPGDTHIHHKDNFR